MIKVAHYAPVKHVDAVLPIAGTTLVHHAMISLCCCLETL